MHIDWVKALYATGWNVIDDQHQTLFKKMNEMGELIDKGASKDEIGKVIDFLADYAIKHFSCEEELMEKHNCSTKEKNKVAHKYFLEEFTKVKNQFAKEGASEAVIKGIQQTLFTWLRSHIMCIDIGMKNIQQKAA